MLPGEYAFVLHTASPFTGARGEMYGELVCGLGETLVGNHPGRPLAFSDKPDGSDMQVSRRTDYHDETCSYSRSDSQQDSEVAKLVQQ